VIDADTVMPALLEPYVEELNGRCLVLNARGPRWVLTSPVVAEFLKRCDGRSTLRGIARQMGIESAVQLLLPVLRSLLENRFFRDGERPDIQRLGSVCLYVTRRCNLSCPYCYYDSGPTVEEPHAGVLSTREWIGLAEQAAAVNPRVRVIVIGGEPLLRRDLVDMLEGIGRCVDHVRLVTNGTLVTRQVAARLARVRPLSVQVSIDSVVPKENARTRGAGSLDKALRAARWLRDAGVDVTVSATLTGVNRNSLWRLQRYCEQNRYAFRTSCFFQAGTRSKQNAPRLGIAVSELWATLVRAGERSGPQFLDDEAARCLRVGVRRYGCGVGYGMLAVNPDGTISPCGHLTAPELALGDVRATGLVRAAESGYAAYRRLDVDLLPGCSECPVRYLCAGGCRASSFHQTGDMLPVPHDCAVLRRACIDSMWVDLVGAGDFLARLQKDLAHQRREKPCPAAFDTRAVDRSQTRKALRVADRTTPTAKGGDNNGKNSRQAQDRHCGRPQPQEAVRG